MSETDAADGPAPVFGVPGYEVPNGTHRAVESWTVPKAALSAGSVFTPGKLAVPGPGTYGKEVMKKSFAAACRGGTMAKGAAGEWAKSSGKSPAVGTYDQTLGPQMTPRTLGGVFPKRDRGCYLYDKAVKDSKSTVAPGKYTPTYSDPRPRIANFGVSKPEKQTKGTAQIGPGSYELKYPAEKTLPNWTIPKDPAKSFLDKQTKHSGSYPGPGSHMGQTAGPKSEDREGVRLHSARLLADHIVTPRRPRS